MSELFLQYRQPAFFVLLAAFAAYQLWKNRGLLAAYVPAFKSEAKADDAGDFAALATLRKRFEAAKCKEGLEACDVALRHFFHHEEHG